MNYFVFLYWCSVFCVTETGVPIRASSDCFLHFPLVFVPMNHNPNGEFKIFMFWFPLSTLLNCLCIFCYNRLFSFQKFVKDKYEIYFPRHFFLFCLEILRWVLTTHMSASLRTFSSKQTWELGGKLFSHYYRT